MAGKILVTGATGRQGGAVARHLLKDGWDLRALTRSPDKDEALAFRQKGVEIVKGDLGDPQSVRKALDGVYGVYSVQQFWEHGFNKEVQQGKTLADEAKKVGVAHFVYSSVGSAYRSTGIPHFESKWKIEEHIRSLGLRYTILRPVFFMENFMASDMLSSIREGTLALGLDPQKRLQMIAVDDIGAFAALAFKNPDEYIGKEIDIAGDELTGPDIANGFAHIMQKEVKYHQIPIEEIQAFSDEYAIMMEWFNVRGYEADIPALRKTYPELKTFRNWIEMHWATIVGESVRVRI
ncbi:MAG: NAD(P)H-binding protein [Chitinivibrionales bacterium]|nr:NAD(P)H-binding protein [Chitinivibrionales bacterium]